MSIKGGVKGGPKTPNSGRKPGTPNRKTELLIDKCERLNIDPFAALLELTREDDLSIRLGALKEVCQYLFPKRKALEVSGELNNPFADKSVEELEKLIKESMK